MYHSVNINLTLLTQTAKNICHKENIDKEHLTRHKFPDKSHSDMLRATLN